MHKSAHLHYSIKLIINLVVFRKIDFTKDDMASKELSDNNRNVKQEKKEYPLTECEYKKRLKAAENVDDLKASKETDILT